MTINTGQDLFHLVDEGRLSIFTEFYTQIFQKLLLASDKYVKDVFVAEEIVQDVFLRIWEYPEDLKEIKSLNAYLYKSVINASINHITRQKNIALHHLKIAEASSEEDIRDIDLENEMIVMLHQEINKLPPQCQKVFKLSRFEHLKYKEIAQKLDISERTVENHIGTALKTLKKVFAEKKLSKRQEKGRDFLMSLLF